MNRKSIHFLVALIIIVLCVFGEDFVAGDLFANLISLGGLVVAIYTLIVGGKKVSNLLDEYRKKRNSALFGFYTNLSLFIKRLRKLTTDSNGSPLGVLNLLSSEDDLREKNKGFMNIGQKLSDLSLECLQYLSNSPKQVPPVTSLSEWNVWHGYMKDLVNFLNYFYTIGSGVYFPDVKTTQEILTFHSNFKELLDKIEGVISKQYEQFFDDMEKDALEETS